VFLPSDPQAYEEASQRVMATLREFPVVVEVLGWDEAFLGALTDDPEALAAEIQRAVLVTTGLACSVGIGDNKHRAKIATGFAKPAGIYRLTKDNWVAVMAGRATDSLWGIGQKTAAKLAEMGLATVGQLAAADPQVLAKRFGPATGPYLRLLARGAGGTTVTADPWVPRSRSHEITYEHDLTDRAEIAGQVSAMAMRLAHETAEEGRRVARVGVKVRFVPFFTRIRSMTLPVPTNDGIKIERAALTVLDRFEETKPVRLLGVRVEFEQPQPDAD
jgi:DNA polymerase-4